MDLIKPSKTIKDKIVLTNINRIYYLSIISVIIRVLSIINIYIKSVGRDINELVWKKGIIMSHGIYLVVMLFLAYYSHRLKKVDKVGLSTLIIQYLAIISVLYISIVIVAIDQLVTNSITPFLIGCLATGTIFIIEPISTLLIYFIGYIIYFFMIGITQIDPIVLLSNRVNGVSSITLGVFLSILLWRYNVINISQENHIKCQQKELEDKNKELEYLANYDSLTNIYNRRYFEKRADEEIRIIKNKNVKLCLLILDIDDFKNINDRYGHPVGDQVLKEFAKFLLSEIRQIDIVARIGGEEFAILLIDTGIEQGQIIAERIRRKIAEHAFIIDDKNINITISMGISLINKEQDSFHEAYRLADNALYIAKANGKNKVRIIEH